MQCCVYAHALSCTEHMSRKRIWSLKWRTKTKKKKLAIYRSWPWISNCWLWDSNSGLSGIEPRALTTRPRRLGANLRRDATSRLLFLNQSVLADFDPRKKRRIRILRLVAFQARVIRACCFGDSQQPLPSHTSGTAKMISPISWGFVHLPSGK